MLVTAGTNIDKVKSQYTVVLGRKNGYLYEIVRQLTFVRYLKHSVGWLQSDGYLHQCWPASFGWIFTSQWPPGYLVEMWSLMEARTPSHDHLLPLLVASPAAAYLRLPEPGEEPGHHPGLRAVVPLEPGKDRLAVLHRGLPP